MAKELAGFYVIERDYRPASQFSQDLREWFGSVQRDLYQRLTLRTLTLIMLSQAMEELEYLKASSERSQK